MKILVTGVDGQLGYDIVRECNLHNIEAVGVDINDMNITVQEDVEKVIYSGNYDAIIHCAAWTAVDLAEDEKEKCFDVNVNGTKYIADCCRELKIPLMFFSTDYVFSGEGTHFWNEYDETAPINSYGESKLLGEKIVSSLDKHFIIRISWVFGINGNNFVKTMLKLASQRDELSVVGDQIGSPTYTSDLSRLVIEMINSDKYGTYHATNEGTCSWYEFAKEIFDISNVDINVTEVDSSLFPTKAKRPKNSRMSKEELTKNGFNPLPCWKDALKRYIY